MPTRVKTVGTLPATRLQARDPTMPLASNAPKPVRHLLDALARDLPTLLDGRLTGLYLYGSLTQDAFDPARSDIDAIAVTESDLSEAEFARIGAWLREAGSDADLAPWVARLQLQFLVRRELLEMDGAGCLFHDGQWRRSGSDGNPIVWHNILASGVTMAGAPPAEILPEITHDRMSDALVRELGYLAETLDDEENPRRDRLEYRAYAVLTVCRILYTHAHAEMAVVSKPAAADWALARLPMRWHPLIELARAANKGLEDEDLAPEPVRDFVDFGAESIIGPPERQSEWTWARSG